MVHVGQRIIAVWCMAAAGLAGDVQAAAARGASVDAASGEESTAGNLSLVLPPGWQAAPSQAADEAMWFDGNASAPDACFSIVRDRPFEEFGAVLTVTSQTDGTFAGLRGRRYEGTLEMAAGSGRAAIWVLQQDDGAILALVCTARSDRWEQYDPIFARILASVRIDLPKPQVLPKTQATAPTAGTPSMPGVSPLPPDPSPVSPAEPSPEPRVQASIGIDPSFAACPPGKRWYVHGRGDYRFLIPSDWTVRENMARDQSDFDFDTIYDSGRRCLLVCARVCERVTDANSALDRWQKQRQQHLGQVRVEVIRLQAAGHPGLLIYYSEPSTGLLAASLGFVAQGRRYPLTVYAKPELGINGVLDVIRPMLSSLELLRDRRALTRWRPVQTGPFRLRVPPDWQSVNATFFNPSTVGFDCDNEAWIYIEKNDNRSSFTADLDPLLKTEEFRVGNRAATAYTGTLRESGSTKMVVVLDHPEADGQSYGFWCQTRKGCWARHESTFRQFLAQVQSDSPPDEPSDLKPWPVGQLKQFDEMAGLRLENRYSIVAYHNGAVIREEGTGRTETVFVGHCDPNAWSSFHPTLQQNHRLAEWLGPAVSRCVPVFEDQIRVQLFDGGAMVSATPTRAIWYCWHARRSE